MKKRKNIKWTDEMIREKALQYSTIKLEQKTIDKFIKNNMNLLNKDGVTNV